MNERSLTVAAYCKAYGVGRTKAFELLRNGSLERAAYGRRTCITVRSAEALLEAAVAEAAKKRGA